VNNFISKNHKILAIIGGIVIVLVITSGLLFGPFNEVLPDSLREKLGYSVNSDIDNEITVQLFIDFDGEQQNINVTITIPANHSATAYSILLQANLTVEYESYPNGKYITSIGGVAEDMTHYWRYLVDNESGNVAADRYDLRSFESKIVSWIFRTY